MSNLDDKIREALAAEDAELFDEVAGEPSLQELVLESFRGKWRLLTAMTVVVMFAMFAGAIYCLVQFFGTDDVATRLAWGLGVWFGMQAVGMLKLWHWMEFQRLAVTREIKRVELQIARLSQRLDGR
ncbi:MAG: hypothetical protein DHS20C14_19510 [Phycisphaeraceae bacterium]|nr:MAG: hypothetical protein DHS20C14_19510 [Phycisphaeraceae bacterium]